MAEKIIESNWGLYGSLAAEKAAMPDASEALTNRTATLKTLARDHNEFMDRISRLEAGLKSLPFPVGSSSAGG